MSWPSKIVCCKLKLLAQKPMWAEIRKTPAESLKSSPQGAPTSKIIKGKHLAHPSSTPRRSWPLVAQLINPAKGKGDLKLTDQNLEIQSVVRATIKRAICDLLFKHSFPELGAKVQYVRKILLDTTQSQGSSASDIKEHLKVDSDFVAGMGGLVRVETYDNAVLNSRHFIQVIDCIPIFRGNVKQCAATVIATSYELGKGSGCQERVKTLLARDLYIFPGSWSGENPCVRDYKVFHTSILLTARNIATGAFNHEQEALSPPRSHPNYS